MRYADSRYQKDQRDTAYRIYVTEALRMTAENTAKFSGGIYPTSSYLDSISPKEEDTRTGEEIAADIIKRAGIEVIMNDPV